jgi:hypothetical protein
MREFAKMAVLDVWYFDIDMETALEQIEDETAK